MKKLNLFVFIAIMGSATLALATKLLSKNQAINFFAYVLEISIIAVFLFYFGLFLLKVFRFREFSEELKNPQINNLYSTIAIASALISIMLIKIGIPFFKYNIQLSFIFWLVSLILSLYFIVAIPINLKFRVRVEDVLGTWFIPPVGLFVLISAGAVLGEYVMKNTITWINLFLFGPAFILYILTLNLVYFRSKFSEAPKKEVMPSFNITLAPVGVSILAVLFTSKIIGEFYGIGNIFVDGGKFYSLVMFGYGLWIIFGLLFLYKRTLKEMGEIPFSSIWWAFVFPLGAFDLASFSLYRAFHFYFFKIVYLTLYFILVVLWIYVFYRECKGGKNGKN